MNGNMGMGLERIKSGVVKRVKKENATIESGETINKKLGEAEHGKFKIEITPEEQMIVSPYAEGEKEQKEAQNMYEKLSREIKKDKEEKLKEENTSPRTKLEDLFKKN